MIRWLLGWSNRTGFDAAYVGGYVTGGSQAIADPRLTMTEQVKCRGSFQRLDIGAILDLRPLIVAAAMAGDDLGAVKDAH